MVKRFYNLCAIASFEQAIIYFWENRIFCFVSCLSRHFSNIFSLVKKILTQNFCHECDGDLHFCYINDNVLIQYLAALRISYIAIFFSAEGRGQFLKV